MAVDIRRVRTLNEGRDGDGPVVYWMNRDQRVRDNWALLYAQQLALELRQSLAVVVSAAPNHPGVTVRQLDFMLSGLESLQIELGKYGVPLFVQTGRPTRALLTLVKGLSPGALVTDFSPLKTDRSATDEVGGRMRCPVYEVDAHNIVPCWEASDKQEYAAYTIRPKINRKLPEFLTEYPRLRKHPMAWTGEAASADWSKIRKTVKIDRSVGILSLASGEAAAARQMMRFLKEKLADYGGKRNDPLADAQSQLSPYLHFGQISAQRVALETQKFDGEIGSQEAFLEELIVRRELSDNFCFYNAHYDSCDGFPTWAKQTLKEHRSDPRQHLYSFEQFESAETHDDLWNAAQMQMVLTGKMHGYLRMYWAKKILEWSPSPEAAFDTALSLNDKYELDGCDPNGYCGVAWSIGGVHDRPWFERDIFGKVRYMSSGGCRRKFDVPGYICRISELSD